jgi:hypothetical protein
MARTHGAWSQVVREGTEARKQAWQAMRIKRSFTRSEILCVSQISHTNLLKFVQGLERTGFLRLEQRRVNGRPGSTDRFLLVRNTGPKPPILHLDGSMTDPNTGEQYSATREAAHE